jgi:hypothetical protein
VKFCDLVGSKPLAVLLDAEGQRAVVHTCS